MITNIKSLGLLRNGKVYASKAIAEQALVQDATNDGVAKLARYLDDSLGGQPIIRTMVGFYANAAEMEDAGGGQSHYTILDIEGSSAEITEIKAEVEEINEKIGDGIDGTTLTIAINDINERIGSGFTDEYTIADAISQLDYSLTLHLDRSETETEFKYTLTQGDTEVGVIDIAKDIFIQYAEVVNGYWSGTTFTEDPAGPDKAIKLVFQDTLHEPLYINIEDLVTLYVGGNGIDINDDTISIKIDGDSEAFLTVGEDGLKLDGIQQAIDDAIEAAKLHESDGIKILANNKIKAHAATTIGDGITNPIYVDAEGIKLNKELDMGFYDYQTVVNTLPSTSDAANSNVVMTTDAALAELTTGTKYNSITVEGAEFPTTDVKLNAKDVTISDVVINGEKGASNGRILFTGNTININGAEVESGTTAYNVFEGSQTTDEALLVKNFTMSNVNVDNTQLKHNVANIYNPANDAVITIKDSYFNIDCNNTNVLRMSNMTDATGVTINFENITWTYENAPHTDVAYAGLMIFQAYRDSAVSGDTSKIATWTINVKDCVYNGVKVNGNNFGLINQVAYLYGIGGSSSTVDPTTVMTINFE